MRAVSTMLLGLCFAALPGCSGCDHGDGATPDPAPHTSRARAVGSKQGPSISGFRQRLQQEAKERQAVSLTAEEVFASLETAGVPLDRKRQQMASPHFARFCMSAHAGQRVQLTVCEHDSEERADENVKATQTLERPERRVAKNATTTLLTRRDLNSDAEALLVDTIVRAFEAIKIDAD